VIDAKGKTVGRLVGYDSVVLTVDGVWLAILVDPTGFTNAGPTSLNIFYTSINCSGAGYMVAGLPSFAWVVSTPSTFVAQPTLFFPGLPNSRTLRSSNLTTMGYRAVRVRRGRQHLAPLKRSILIASDLFRRFKLNRRPEPRMLWVIYMLARSGMISELKVLYMPGSFRDQLYTCSVQGPVMLFSARTSVYRGCIPNRMGVPS